MAKISINTQKQIGKIKPMHSVGQPPLGGTGKTMFQHFHYLTEIGAPYSRLHDVGGVFGGNRFVDIPNIFRDFDADENDPKNYDFTFTDGLITALIDAGIEPYYRLGVTIENQAEIKAYRIHPPKDYAKWARICEHIIAHYIDGWANGFNYKITYWEIWNEPDDGMRVSEMWTGTAEDYFRLYEVTAKHLKSIFGDRIKIGGYAAMEPHPAMDPEKYIHDERYQYFADFFHGFFKHIKETNAPIDFFSWHSYYNTAETLPASAFVREYLDKNGFKNTESHLNEWNPGRWTPGNGSAELSTEIAAMIVGMQKTPLDMLMLYDAKFSPGTYCALFEPYTQKPYQAYYVIAAFNFLYQIGTEVETVCNDEGIYAVAASNGDKTAIMIVNNSGKDTQLEIDGVDLSNARYYAIDKLRLLSWSPAVKTIEKNTTILIEI